MKKHSIAVSVFIMMAAISAAAQSSNQSSFDLMKSLVGNWEGQGQKMTNLRVSYKLTAGGSALMGELQNEMDGKSEEMISMIHLDNGRLLLTHYCSAGNQPRMQATASPDGKTITFDFVDATNLASTDAPHMKSVMVTFVDANHHTEEWHFAIGGKEMVEKFDLQKKG